MISKARILIVDDDRTFRLSTAALLRQEGHVVEVAADAAEGAAKLGQSKFDLLLLDMRMPGVDGLAAIEVLRTQGLEIPILMISGFGTVESAVESLHLGADHFLRKPVDPDLLAAKVAELLERRPAEHRLLEGTFEGMIGHSRAMRAVFEAIERVAPTETTVLIQGETGTGKELVARAVHNLSPRRSKPFVAVNCAALAEGVLESELFGHVKGAFTGAVASRPGLFAAANGGTLFLDEIGDVSIRLQQRLLRVLQEHEVLPVGASKPEEVSVRIVAATHRDLEAELRAGRFREDLYYRLNVFRIEIPALRERRADIPLLVEAALGRLRERPDAATSLSPLAMRIMRGHSWPGNVRELFSVVESAVIRAGGTHVNAEHLPASLRSPSSNRGTSPSLRASPESAREDRSTIEATLLKAGGSRTRAAEMLGISRTTLWRRMREFGLDLDR